MVPLNLTFLGWLTIVISNFLVLLRIWTVVPRGHKLVTWTFGFFVPLQLASFGVSTWVIINMLPLFYADPLTGLCLFSAHPPHVYALWVVGLPFEVLVFGLVSWNALDRPRSFTPDSSVARTLFTDGLLYFMVLTSLRVANTVISATAPTSLLFVGVYFIWAACTTTTTRLIINSRKHALKKAASAPSPQPRDSGTYMSSWTGNWKLDRG
ncbi:hypothetical protein C8J57DRAFT_1286966 [Mycena rebaudengoi]|nr:hypothetical protein C8J57DRAFT_1286966 [Mycena rebaudengoi]